MLLFYWLHIVIIGQRRNFKGENAKVLSLGGIWTVVLSGGSRFCARVWKCRTS